MRALPCYHCLSVSLYTPVVGVRTWVTGVWYCWQGASLRYTGLCQVPGPRTAHILQYICTVLYICYICTWRHSLTPPHPIICSNNFHLQSGIWRMDAAATRACDKNKNGDENDTDYIAFCLNAKMNIFTSPNAQLGLGKWQLTRILRGHFSELKYNLGAGPVYWPMTLTGTWTWTLTTTGCQTPAHSHGASSNVTSIYFCKILFKYFTGDITGTGAMPSK